MCFETINRSKSSNNIISIDEDSKLIVQYVVPTTIVLAEKFIELNPLCSIEIKVSDAYSMFKLNLNDPYKNWIIYNADCFDVYLSIDHWIEKMVL